MRQVGQPGRGAAHLQDVPQLQRASLLLARVQTRPLGEGPPQDVPARPHRRPVPTRGQRLQGAPAVTRTAVATGAPRVFGARPRLRQNLLLQSRAGRAVRGGRGRRLGGQRPAAAGRTVLRALVRLAADRNGQRAVQGTAAAVQGLQPGHAARRLRGHVRRQRGAQLGRRQVGAPDHHALRQGALAQVPHRACAAGQFSDAAAARAGHHARFGQSRDADSDAAVAAAGGGDATPRAGRRQHPAAAEAARRVVAQAVPRRLPQAGRLRRQQQRALHAGHHLSEGLGQRTHVHVHHHAGGRTRQAAGRAHRLEPRADGRRRRRARRVRKS